MPPEAKLGILLISGDYERAHYAFMLAAAAAAIGRPVTLFATNGGCHALATDWTALQGQGRTATERDAEVQASGVGGLTTLREAATELGATLMACDAGLRLANILPASLLPGVGVAGIPTFLAAVGAGQVITL